ncbi:MAG: hypothetical protein ABEL04_00050 [Salinibacter sp.]|uniref:DUF6929 family protein n=1 Tax=Salinibacter sp. TaxID=2065818 RepID=UPI0035D4DF8F
MPDTVQAIHDESLACRVVRSSPLTYDDEPHPEVTDRPPHVRAASSLVLLVDRYAIVQDDANFLALIDPDSHEVRSHPLPAGPQGLRVFDYDEGTGHHKLDLEACAVVPGTEERLLVAFGSGSAENREWIVTVDWRGADDEPDTDLAEAPALYQHLREQTDFSGSGLNVEGAIFVEKDRLRLFQRGNAEPTDTLGPVDATGDLQWSALAAHLNDPEQHPPPELQNVVQYDLGTLHDVRLTFSDAMRHDGAVLFSASAEDETTGDVVGSVLGVIDEDGARLAELIDEDGTPFEGKVEGLSVHPGSPNRASFVIDADASDEPSLIYEAELDGSWH